MISERCLVPAAGVEPATFRSGGERSNPLSYAGLNKIAGSKRCTRNVPLSVPPRQYRAALVVGHIDCRKRIGRISFRSEETVITYPIEPLIFNSPFWCRAISP